MRPTRYPLWAAVLLGALVLGVGCTRSGSQDSGAPAEEEPYRLTGPFDHGNVTVFFLCSREQDEGDYLTLDEGLKTGVVKVSEKEQEQVGELRIDNQSDRPLFLQEGDRLQGGKQDRTLVTSMVVPPKSGPTALPTMCIEQGRWAERGDKRSFDATDNPALAPKAIRGAAKVQQAQGEVWQQVASQKRKAESALQTSNSNSSLNETLDAPQVKKLSEECAKALGDAVQAHPDAVGVAIAVNGVLEEVNVYPNHSLLRRLYPRLLQSYALQAALEKEKSGEAPTVTAEMVTRFLKEGQEKAQATRDVDTYNRLKIVDKGAMASCSTEYQGKQVHYQVLSKDPTQSIAGSAPSRQETPAQQMEQIPAQARPAPNAQPPAPQPPAPPTPDKKN